MKSAVGDVFDPRIITAFQTQSSNWLVKWRSGDDIIESALCPVARHPQRSGGCCADRDTSLTLATHRRDDPRLQSLAAMLSTRGLPLRG